MQSSLAITTANAQPATADGISAATQADAAQAGSALVTGVQVQAGTGGASLRFAHAVIALAARAPSSPALAQATTINQTQPCSLGGSMTVSGNVAGTNGLTVGDSVSISAASCVEMVDGMATTMSGSMAIVVTAGSLTDTSGYPRDITLGVTASNFTAASAAETDVTSGDMSLRVREDSSTVASLTLSGAMLSNSVTTSRGTRSYTQRNYEQTISMNGSAATYGIRADIETNNSRLGSAPVTYSVRTPSPLAVNAAGDFTSGILVITGRNSSLQASVTAINTFQIQVDTNGDGGWDSTSTATAAELRALM